MSPRTSRTSARVLLVEGPDDLHVIEELWSRQLGLDPTWTSAPKEGADQLLRSLYGEVNTSKRQVVGVVIDADGDVRSRWVAIRDQLRRARIQAPEHREQAGTIITATRRKPRVGVWIMPDNASPGELEDFVAQMVPTGDLVWPRAEHYIASIPESDRKFTETKTTRAIVHAWLATREDPRRMGTAIRAGDLQTNGDLCNRFLNWLQRLFE